MTASTALTLIDELLSARRISSVEAEVLRNGAPGPQVNLSPGDFRRSLGLSMAAMAIRVGVIGHNPSRTWQRWEDGEHKPPYEIVEAVAAMSGGRVSFASWASVRQGTDACVGKKSNCGMFEILRTHLLALAAAYTYGTGVNAPGIGKLAVNDHNFFRRVEARQDFTVRSYDRAYAWFATHWPVTASWLENVPRQLADGSSSKGASLIEEHAAP